MSQVPLSSSANPNFKWVFQTAGRTIAFWIVLILIMPTSIWMQAFAFILFRFFDAVKPGPIGMIDRHFKNNESKANAVSSIPQILWRGFGIMVDDLAAAFFTLLIIALVQVFIR